jgi:hypothetical protein
LQLSPTYPPSWPRWIQPTSFHPTSSKCMVIFYCLWRVFQVVSFLQFSAPKHYMQSLLFYFLYQSTIRGRIVCELECHSSLTSRPNRKSVLTNFLAPEEVKLLVLCQWILCCVVIANDRVFI